MPIWAGCDGEPAVILACCYVRTRPSVTAPDEPRGSCTYRRVGVLPVLAIASSRTVAGRSQALPSRRSRTPPCALFGVVSDTSGGQLALAPRGRGRCVLLLFLYRPAAHSAAAYRTWTLRCLQAPQPKVSSMSTGRQTVTSGGDATPAASMNGPMSD